MAFPDMAVERRGSHGSRPQAISIAAERRPYPSRALTLAIAGLGFVAITTIGYVSSRWTAIVDAVEDFEYGGFQCPQSLVKGPIVKNLRIVEPNNIRVGPATGFDLYYKKGQRLQISEKQVIRRATQTKGEEIRIDGPMGTIWDENWYAFCDQGENPAYFSGALLQDRNIQYR